MKTIVYLLAFTLVTISCKQKSTSEQPDPTAVDSESVVGQEESATMAYQSFGDEITDEGVLSKSEMMAKYKNMKPGDTVAVKFESKVNAVCKNKGCWMRLDMGEDEAMVKFKDYGFFMPKDIDGETVIVEGLAYVDEMSVDEQRHYAEDDGKSKEEVEAITEPKRTLSFLSNGVLLEEKQ